MADVEVLGLGFSYYVRSVCMALEEKGVTYTLTPSRPHSPEIDAIHPLGKIPCLRHGDFSLCESKAICTYIDRAFEGPKLMPDEPKAAALVEQWISIFNATMMPTFQAYLAAYLFPPTADLSPDRPAIEAAVPVAERHLTLLDRTLSRTAYLAGDSFSMADIAALPMLYYLSEMPETGRMFKEAPALSAYLEKNAKRPSFVKTAPPPTAELKESTHAMLRARRAG